MTNLVSYLNDQPHLTIAAVIACGILLGSVRIGFFSLGASGVLFTAMALGHLGVHLPPLVGDLGVVLFVYSVGLQAGPHFIRSIRSRGWSFVALAVLTLLSAWGSSLVVAKVLGLDGTLVTGMFAGALTSTPALAAALQTHADPQISVGFGLAYPFGAIGVILGVQLLPRLLKIDWPREIALAKQANGQEPISYSWFRINNPQIDGKTVSDLELQSSTTAVVSRVMVDELAYPARANTRLAVGQHVRVVGTVSELSRLEIMLGPRCEDMVEPPSEITAATLVVTEAKFCGKPLKQLGFRERYGVSITRMWRDEFEFIPSGSTSLEFGDEIRIVGNVGDCQQVTEQLGHRPERLHETRFLSVGLGLLAGILLGVVPLTLPGGFKLQLGLAGGPLVAGLIAGHFGRLGPVSFRMPTAARIFMNEFGLILFLASAGVHAGESFWSVIRGEGPSMLLSAAILVLVPLLASFAICRYAMGWDALHSLGAVCGAMTCTPGLGVVSKLADSSVPASAYVAVYPFALIVVTLLAPLLDTVLGLM